LTVSIILTNFIFDFLSLRLLPFLFLLYLHVLSLSISNLLSYQCDFGAKAPLDVIGDDDDDEGEDANAALMASVLLRAYV
jgi:hypothetical protein